MRLVILNAGPDTAGVGIGLKQAFDKHTDWYTRAVCRQLTYLDYPVDIYWPRDNPRRIKRQVIELVRTADVIHVMDNEAALRWFRPWLRRQKIIVHHLGSRFRANPEAVSAQAQAYEATEVTDSIDLMLFPHISWLPVPVDTDALLEMRRHRPDNAPIRIAHAPTHRSLKNTEQIEAAITELQKKYPITFDLIEGVSNRECLERKAQADIFVDQLMYGFGVNDIECWAMGIPVVSGWEDPVNRERCLSMWGQLPWADASEATLLAVIEHLILNEQWRAELGQRGRAHAERWHSREAVVQQTLKVYERAGMKAAA